MSPTTLAETMKTGLGVVLGLSLTRALGALGSGLAVPSLSAMNAAASDPFAGLTLPTAPAIPTAPAPSPVTHDDGSFCGKGCRHKEHSL